MGDTVGEQREWNMGEAMNLTMGGETTKSFQGSDWGYGRIDIAIFNLFFSRIYRYQSLSPHVMDIHGCTVGGMVAWLNK